VNKSLPTQVIYAHGIHTGGGLTLLKEVFSALEANEDFLFILDQRIRTFASSYNLVNVCYFESGLRGRIKSECYLKRHDTQISHILSFNSLPFFLSIKAKLTVFFQNINLLSDSSHSGFLQKFKSLIFRVTSHRVDQFIVQTETVLRRLSKDTHRYCRLGTLLNEQSCQHLRENKLHGEELRRGLLKFIYVADSAKHKNHITLIKAWQLIKSNYSHLEIELFFTLDSQTGQYWERLSRQFDMESLSIFNLGVLTEEDMLDLYRSSDVLIFPSLGESLGLPLIESSVFNLDILAPELDYVRDVVNPVEVFDPNSHISIYRSIARYLGLRWPISIRPMTAQQLIEEVFCSAQNI